MSIVLSPLEARVILHNISWSLYEQLLAAHEDKSSPRFVYDRGELEITVPSYEHEELNRLMDNCIALIALEWNIGDLSRKREISEQFVWLNRQYGETEAQLSRSAITPSIRADSSQDEGL